MTEDEAKKKWCPMVRDVRASNGAMEIGSGFCKASECMMWRDNLDRVLTGRDIIVTDGNKRNIVKETVPSGYCGLAGKP